MILLCPSLFNVRRCAFYIVNRHIFETTSVIPNNIYCCEFGPRKYRFFGSAIAMCIGGEIIVTRLAQRCFTEFKIKSLIGKNALGKVRISTYSYQTNDLQEHQHTSRSLLFGAYSNWFYIQVTGFYIEQYYDIVLYLSLLQLCLPYDCCFFSFATFSLQQNRYLFFFSLFVLFDFCLRFLC